ncbi:ankyrin repeat domain-containing protein [Endozoicomonas sp. SESOKO1]|uniref:ankyrin repeat domain-containing protein n=1 Tax=Endozoicomonas sp. SESOKO1 TaxID=2828742 RepID=UPI002147D3B3
MNSSVSTDSSGRTDWGCLYRQGNTRDADTAPGARKRTKSLSCFNRSLLSLENTPGCPGLSNTFSENREPVRRWVSLPDLTPCSYETNAPSGCSKLIMTKPQWAAGPLHRESEASGDADNATGCLLLAIERNDCEAVQFLVKDPSVDLNRGVISKSSKHRCTPLMLAIEKNFLEVARIILNVEMVEIDKVLGLNALHIAAQHGQIDAVDLLLRSGADVNIPDLNGWTSLMKAVATKNEAVIRLLLGYQADVKLINSLGLSALNILVNDENTERPDLLLLLLEHGAPIDQCDRNSWFPLIIAIKNGYLQYIRILLNESWEKATCQKEGLVFLFAAVHGDESLLRYLYDKMPKRYLSFKDINQYYPLRGVPVSYDKTSLTLLKDRFGEGLSPELPDAFFSLKSWCRRVIQQRVSGDDFGRLPLPEQLRTYCAQAQFPVLVDNEQELWAFYTSEYEVECREDWFLTWDSLSPIDSVDRFHEEIWG